MPILHRTLSAILLAALVACANGGVSPSGDETADGPPAGGAPPADAPAETDPADGDAEPAPGDTTVPSVEVPGGATAIEFEVVGPASGHGLAINDRRRVVVRTSDEWRALWNQLFAHMMPPPDPFPVDFDQRMAIFAAMGQRTHGGHSVTVESVEAAPDGKLYVTVLEATPGPTCVTPQVMSSPAVTVTLEKRSEEVVFVERRLTLQC